VTVPVTPGDPRKQIVWDDSMGYGSRVTPGDEAASKHGGSSKDFSAHGDEAARLADLELRVARLERALTTAAWWLVQAQTGFGVNDARGIEDILRGEKDGEA